LRVLALTAVITAAAALAACRPDHPPQSAGVLDATAQDTQPMSAAAQSDSRSVAELPPVGAPANLDANGPPLDILKPPL
jgi:hypothetical protein